MHSSGFCWTALLFPALLLLSGAANASQNPQEPPQTIRIQVERVNVGVIVTDARGQFVGGLRREDFHIFDNGTEQPLTDFAAVEEPAQVLLLIEAGPAVYLLEGGHLQAAFGLLNGLSAGDRVAVVKYAEAPQGILDFTTDKPAAAAAFEQLHFNLGFGSLNLSSSVSNVLEWLTRVRGKKTIVLLSTGVDTSAVNERAKVLQQLKSGDVRLLAVSLAGGLQDSPAGSKKKTAAKNPAQPAQQFAQANQLLKQMAEATGGRAYFPANEKEFGAAYAEIAQLVRHEYSLAFTPPVRDGAVHSIEVRIDVPQTATPKAAGIVYRLDHRRAYVAPAPQ